MNVEQEDDEDSPLGDYLADGKLEVLDGNISDEEKSEDCNGEKEYEGAPTKDGVDVAVGIEIVVLFLRVESLDRRIGSHLLINCYSTRSS